MENLDKTFKPTTEWMAKKYDEMNQKLFGGKLMACEFDVFTRGAGMEGGTLGWFCMEGGIRVERYGRAMFKQRGWERLYINRDNFVSIAKPVIKLNGNYTGTEKSFLTTLVHEMCHYYTYMNGYAPKQAHGREFKEIGMIVSRRSNDFFSIQRLASAEQMEGFELNDEMKAKRAKRLENKKASVTAIVYVEGGDTKLTITSNKRLIDMISSSRKDYSEMYVSNDADVIEFLFSKGYKKNFRTWRFWRITDKPWLNELKNLLTGNSDIETKQEEKQPSMIFSIKTSNGLFEYDGSDQNKLINTIKERFPNMSDESISRIVNNKANYRLKENRVMKRKNIIKEVIDEFMNREFGLQDDSIEISPNLNLGIESIE